MIISFHLLPILFVSFFVNFGNAGTGLPCELKWEANGYGRIPKYSISAGVKNYVARILIDTPTPIHYSGYLDQTSGMGYFVGSTENAIISETYAILTNPKNCSLTWVPFHAGYDLIPSNAVRVDGDDPVSSYIGRAPFEGTFKSGRTNPPENSFLFAAKSDFPNPESVLRFPFYEILTSEQPSLHVALSKFKFTLTNPILQEIEAASIKELFAVSEIFLAQQDRITFTVESDGVIDEFYDLLEENGNWAAVSSLDLNMILWFGTPPVKKFEVNVDRESAAIYGVRAERDRRLSIRANYSLAKEERSVGCAFAIILEDHDIGFTAKAKFRSDFYNKQNRLGVEEIRQILIDTGRDEATFVNLPDGSVQADIEGRLTGRFVLRSYLLAENLIGSTDLDGYGPCDRHLIDWPP